MTRPASPQNNEKNEEAKTFQPSILNNFSPVLSSPPSHFFTFLFWDRPFPVRGPRLTQVGSVSLLPPSSLPLPSPLGISQKSNSGYRHRRVGRRPSPARLVYVLCSASAPLCSASYFPLREGLWRNQFL